VRRESGLKDELVIGEIGLSTDWKTALDGCDVVVHLAGRAHILKGTAVDPLAVFRMVNTVSTLNLARQSAAMGVRCFVFISSIGVNGAFTRVGEFFTEQSRVRLRRTTPMRFQNGRPNKGCWELSVKQEWRLLFCGRS
jgi:nucleoside-diphosphate-sugar epimerase